jgi:hypothetical protein
MDTARHSSTSGESVVDECQATAALARFLVSVCVRLNNLKKCSDFQTSRTFKLASTFVPPEMADRPIMRVSRR